MKRIFHTLLITLVFCLIAEVGFSQILFQDIINELPVDFKDSVFLKEEQTIKKVRRFNQRVFRTKFLGVDKLRKSEVPIKVFSFNKLYEIAKDKAETIYGDDEIITGFKMHYGYNNSKNQIEIFYQPWYCKFLEPYDGGNKVRGSVEVVEKSKYYKYSEQQEKFVVLNNNRLVDNSKKRFRRKLRILNSAKRRRFRTATDYSADSESSYFTFQEIKKLHDHADSVNDRYKNYLFSFEVLLHKNYAIHKPDTRGTNRAKTFKIASLFTSAGVYNENTNKFEIPDRNKGFLDPRVELSEFANLSGLCPPGCNDFTFPIEND